MFPFHRIVFVKKFQIFNVSNNYLKINFKFISPKSSYLLPKFKTFKVLEYKKRKFKVCKIVSSYQVPLDV